jgi:hypothetical protein
MKQLSQQSQQQDPSEVLVTHRNLSLLDIILAKLGSTPTHSTSWPAKYDIKYKRRVSKLSTCNLGMNVLFDSVETAKRVENAS